MIVMPANSTGWFWHSLARETGRIGHLYSPRAQTGPWPWFPYALDNGAFSCELESMGVESCDGTGWLRGDKTQTAGVEEWARSRAQPITSPLWPHTCKAPRVPEQEAFA